MHCHSIRHWNSERPIYLIPWRIPSSDDPLSPFPCPEAWNIAVLWSSRKIYFEYPRFDPPHSSLPPAIAFSEDKSVPRVYKGVEDRMERWKLVKRDTLDLWNTSGYLEYLLRRTTVNDTRLFRSLVLRLRSGKWAKGGMEAMPMDVCAGTVYSTWSWFRVTAQSNICIEQKSNW